jgi:hypothetical protein
LQGHRRGTAARPGLETSFANGGQISISHPEPWANPSAPATILRWLGRKDAPSFRLRADAKQWRWAASFLRECLPGRTLRNTLAIANLATYSRRELQALKTATGIQFASSEAGILHLFQSRRTSSMSLHVKRNWRQWASHPNAHAGRGDRPRTGPGRTTPAPRRRSARHG